MANIKMLLQQYNYLITCGYEVGDSGESYAAGRPAAGLCGGRGHHAHRDLPTAA